MARIIIVTFAFLGWAFYEMSGGAEFEPASVRLTNIKEDPLKPAALAAEASAPVVVKQPEIEVTRVALDLNSVEDVLSGRADGNTIEAETPSAPENVVTLAALEDADATPTIVLPSLIENAVPETEEVQQVAEVSFYETRTVSGDRVNVRGGPGTSYSVVGKLVRGDEVEILEDTGTGWVRFRAVNDDTSGWLADFLLTGG